jgi:hypothetical protein
MTADQFAKLLQVELNGMQLKIATNMLNGMPADIYPREVRYVRALRDISEMIDRKLKESKDPVK